MSLRLGFLTHVNSDDGGPATASELYRRTTELFVVAEELGYDSGWVAQHHFASSAGRLPAPLVLLGAIAQHTRTIRLGTAVLLIAAENPVRVAEDAAVLDALSDGRLHLGLGTGGDPRTFTAFGVDPERRREQYAEAVSLLRATLAGRPLPGGGRLEPERPELLDRLWQSTTGAESAARISAEHDGLLLAKAAFRTELPTGQAQLPLVQSYLDGWRGSGPPRIGVSRTVYPAVDRRTAVAQLREGVIDNVDQSVGAGLFPPVTSLDGYLARAHVHAGHPDEVVASLRRDEVVPHASELIVQTHPGRLGHDQTIAALELIATRVAPHLGWRRAEPRRPAVRTGAA
ncbi:LLM class flavin-dependent oxidoreductase [Kitasatospora sp. NPDC088351]|uniref:LLM class flavin-dependent oxidoreductase n=1 Tax=unclassified Kitasatospora TaxID=2633591 RepID=UPI0034319FA1